MQCPTCQNTDSRVLESRSADSGKSVRRRRECLNCSFRFTTYERVETMPVSIIKKDGSRELFDKSKVEIQSADSFRQAVLFWVLNKCSYSGLTENSSFSQSASKQNFTLRGANNLKKYQEIISKWEITCLDYTECLHEEGENIFQFLDPPYKIGSYLYGRDAGLHKEFDHAKFAEDCKDAEGNWMITYNIDEEIEEMFKNYNQRYFSITYGMQHRPDNTKKAELLITNYDEEPINPLEQLLYG